MKTIEVSGVPPSPGSETTTLPLTFFDIIWLSLPPVQRLYFYEFPHPTTAFFDSLLPKLKHSLSLSLQYFIPLAGNLTWPQHSHKPIVTYVPGDAVVLTVAESDADFNHLSGSDTSEASKSRHPIPNLITSQEKAAVLALQITLFPDTGFCIGVASHHAVVDGKTSTIFMKSWAYLCNSVEDSSFCSLPPELIPFFGRDMIKDPNQIESRYLKDWLKQGGPNNRSLRVWNLKVAEDAKRGVFELSRLNIEKLKQFAAAKLNGKQLHLSTFTLASAYAWVCKVKAEAEELEGKKVQLAINVDCRPSLEPPLPSTYFGNCIGGRISVAEGRALLGEDGFIVALEAISNALRTLKDGVLSVGAENAVVTLTSLNNEDKIIGIAGTPRFEVYGTDFGLGRPRKVEMTSIDGTGALCFAESWNFNGGIEIGLVLKKRQWRLLVPTLSMVLNPFEFANCWKWHLVA